MPKGQPDYLTETHKIRRALERRKFYYYLMYCLIPLLMSFMTVEPVLKSLYLTETEHRMLKTASRELKKKIEKGKPAIITIYHVYKKFTQKEEKLWRKLAFLGTYVLWFLVFCYATNYAVLFILKKRKEFFYATPKTEEVLPLTDQKVITLKEIFLTETPEDMFQDVEKVEKIINTAITFHDLFQKKIKQGGFEDFVKKKTKEYLAYVRDFYPFLLKEKKTVKGIVRFLLYHHVINFYGNLPTGILSIYIKKEDFKTILSLYGRRLLPVLFYKKRESPYSDSFSVEYKKDRFFSYFFLRAFYECLGEVLKEIEDRWSPFDFVSPIQYQ